ncbi:thiamine pyrophosphate-dependent dehydrogenase E1 component subunit alpha [Engelhardtia mirabilis]|uniref:2-oxoisovalerate dehydrogenase subunit alpha n=1 Tax=Engelhardtia mirabilis TaxID=2528011 RepID=A0A518BRJ2_9BACT|nr:2-oxoisovalerate dehydrogenase subunit alpha [Planctomycetes bacterium Pla133]QDV03918.1 2-oxoisovalerate dehydrogenase subunit alpha [Planctomycetes bacterium Pla86]
MTSTSPLSVIEPDGSVNGHVTSLSKDELMRCYRAMIMVRVFDEICLKLQRSGRIDFSIPNLGVEATQVGAASALRASDWFFPSYRDFGMALYHGVEPVEMMHNMFGNERDTAKGRQMPVHFSFVDPIHFVSISSPIGTHIPQAVGAAYAMQQRGEDTVAICSFGDGGTSSLGFHSGLNFAGVWKSPVVFLCQNNGYAISCPSDEQTASDGYAVKGEAYGIPGVTVDGNDLLAVHQVVADAVARARAGDGPTLIEAKTFRMGGHSTSDDPTRYVPAELVEEWKAKDPVDRFERYLQSRGLVEPDSRAQFHAEARTRIDAAVKEAQAAADPGLETIFSDVYAEIPAHLRAQGQEAYDLAARKGDAAAGDGSFPL